MKTAVIHSLLFLIILSFTASFSWPRKFKVKENKENIVFYYKWNRSNLFNSESPEKLVLKLDNQNDKRAYVRFVIGYYWNGILEYHSDTVEACIPAERSLKGRMNNLAFDHADFENYEIADDDRFSWEIIYFEADMDTQCKRVWKLLPVIQKDN